MTDLGQALQGTGGTPSNPEQLLVLLGGRIGHVLVPFGDGEIHRLRLIVAFENENVASSRRRRLVICVLTSERRQLVRVLRQVRPLLLLPREHDRVQCLGGMMRREGPFGHDAILCNNEVTQMHTRTSEKNSPQPIP